MAECVDMIAFQIIGNDTVVSLAAQAGQFELNVMTPVIVHNILESISLLNHYLPVFTAHCIDGIVANERQPRAHRRYKPDPRDPADAEDRVPQGGGDRPRIDGDPPADPGPRGREGNSHEKEADEMFDLQALAKNQYRDEEWNGNRSYRGLPIAVGGRLSFWDGGIIPIRSC